jgi:hypothetical protein
MGRTAAFFCLTRLRVKSIMMIKLSDYKKIWLPFAHLAGWAVFIRLIFLEDSRLQDLFLKDPLPFTVNILLLAGYFYMNLNWLVPRLLSKKRITAFIGSTAVCFLIIVFLSSWLFYQPPSGHLHPFPQDSAAVFPQRNFFQSRRRPEERDSARHRFDFDEMPRHRPEERDSARHRFDFDEMPRHRSEERDSARHRFVGAGGGEMRPFPGEIMSRLRIYNHAIRFLIIFIISSGLKVITQWYREKQQLQELEKSRVQAELSFLKSQIHPHFLFNCLNSIYYLTLSGNDKAPKTILSLSDFLRFVFTESDSPFIPLEKEVNMLREYLNLQSLRTSEKFELQFVVDGDLGEYDIMPLTFIPFVENAFKYGLSAHSNCFVHIRIAVQQWRLTFACDNSVMSSVKDPARSSGIGLKNIRKRLELAYPDSYSLKIGEDSAGFHVKLQIIMT